MKPPHILVVDDEKSLRDFMRRNLEIRGYNVFTAGNGLEALAIFGNQPVDLIILDIMMPHLDGLETIRRIRQKSLVPIIVLSALDEENDKIQAFNIGADDYLSKPFGIGEMLVRVKAVLRRARWTDAYNPLDTEERVVRGNIVADLPRHEIRVDGNPVELTPTEFNLLVYLMRNAGKVLPHNTILKNVWGPEYDNESEYLRVYIGRLRQKIEKDPNHPQHLLTERGVGYSFEE